MVRKVYHVAIFQSVPRVTGTHKSEQMTPPCHRCAIIWALMIQNTKVYCVCEAEEGCCARWQIANCFSTGL
uniref:Uncharacterized protein n=1 Tax=Hyaloperonospora arabidopsidis (strain Emoy2) TaxID=559515 RepID=M4B2E8_HYAAE